LFTSVFIGVSPAGTHRKTRQAILGGGLKEVIDLAHPLFESPFGFVCNHIHKCNFARKITRNLKPRARRILDRDQKPRGFRDPRKSDVVSTLGSQEEDNIYLSGC
jgi:hypothetical protein